MGILDSKTRIFDTIITLEGRRQISSGKLKIEWVSLTDSATFYEPDSISGSSDATKRIYFETCNLPQDQITFEVDDSGKLTSFKNDKGYKIESGNIYINVNGEQRLLTNDNPDNFLIFFISNEGVELTIKNVKSFVESAKSGLPSEITEKKIILRRRTLSLSNEIETEKTIYTADYYDYIAEYKYIDENYEEKNIYEYILYFSYKDATSKYYEVKITNVKTYNNPHEEAINDLLKSSIENFNKLQIIGTVDHLFNDYEFAVNPENINFSIHNDLPYPDINAQYSNINDLETFIEDKRLRHIDNFLYLPPIEKVEDDSIDIEKESKNTTLYDNKKIKKIGDYHSLGPKYKKSYKDFEYEFKFCEKNDYCRIINFDPTSINNRIFLQMFELSSNSTLKLDIIEFGTFQTDDQDFPSKKVYFAGKVLLNDNGNQTYIHMFTIVLE